MIAGRLREGGVFFVREGHPMCTALDPDAPEGELRLAWPYFNVGPMKDDSPIDYSSPTAFAHPTTYEWAHSLGDILGSLLHAGLTIVDYQEHQTLPWKMVPWMEPIGTPPDTEYQLPAAVRHLCPMTFSLVARR
jgi:hypothetical protein